MSQDIKEQLRDWAKDYATTYLVDGLINQAADHIATLDARVQEAEQEVVEQDALRERLSSILTHVANALKGEPDELSKHSWHDLPEIAATLRQQLAEAQRDAAKWKQIAEYQYALRQYPNELDLGTGALDVYFKGWSFDKAMKLQQIAASGEQEEGRD